jgi:membrane protein YdbS with pleckstrin-like domain
MKISMSATREKFPLSPKKIIKKTLASAVSIVITLLILWGTIVAALFSTRAEITSFGISLSLLMGIVGAVLCVLCIVNIILTYVYYRWYIATYFYDLTPDFIQIRKGPITPREITIPYERIQDVYVDQDLFDRFFGLYDVHLSSATASSGLAAHIDGVEKDVADGLRKVLLDTVKNRISKNRG